MSVRVRLDAGAVAGGGGAATVPTGGCGWRDEAEVSGVEVRRLGVTDGCGVAVRDLSGAVAAQVMPLLRVGGPSVAVGAVLSRLSGFVASDGRDALAHSVGCTDASYPPDLPSFLDDESASGWGRQVCAPDAGLPTTADLDDVPASSGPWADALDHGSADDRLDAEAWSDHA